MPAIHNGHQKKPFFLPAEIIISYGESAHWLSAVVLRPPVVAEVEENPLKSRLRMIIKTMIPVIMVMIIKVVTITKVMTAVIRVVTITKVMTAVIRVAMVTKEMTAVIKAVTVTKVMTAAIRAVMVAKVMTAVIRAVTIAKVMMAVIKAVTITKVMTGVIKVGRQRITVHLHLNPLEQMSIKKVIFWMPFMRQMLTVLFIRKMKTVILWVIAKIHKTVLWKKLKLVLSIQESMLMMI